MWTGLTLGATPTVTAISAPLWGRVGDRYGSKVLVIRSLTAFILTKAGMAFVTAPWQLFALRALLGVFAGYGALTISMAARVGAARSHGAGDRHGADRASPRAGDRPGDRRPARADRRTAQRVPVRRGVLRRRADCRSSCSTRSRASGDAPRKVRGGRAVFAHLFRLPGFLLALVVIFGLQTVDRSFGPVLPLYVAQVGVAGRAHPDRDRRPVLARRDLGGVRPSPRRPVDEPPSATDGHRRRARCSRPSAVAVIVVAPSLVVRRRGDAARSACRDRRGDDDDLRGRRIVAAAGRARDRLRHHDDGVAAGTGGESRGGRLHRRLRTAHGLCRGRVSAGDRWNADLVCGCRTKPVEHLEPLEPVEP